MSQFEDNLCWILQDFKNGQKNFAETIVAIEEQIIRVLGLNSYHSEELKQAHECIKKLEEERRKQDEKINNLPS